MNWFIIEFGEQVSSFNLILYKDISMKKKLILFCTAVFAIIMFNQSASAEEKKFTYLLVSSSAPNSLLILPKPPSYNSVSFLNDQAQYHAGYNLKGTKRWGLAQQDADLGYPDHKTAITLARQFDAAFGMKITQKKTPYIYRILQEIKHDASLVTKPAKNNYKRTRPFVFFRQHSCTPQDEKFLRTNGSYPSGHTTIGWATALVLSEINPKRQNEILKRGYSYGQSGVICGAHWQSDVDAGRIMGAALVARLHADQYFLTWLKRAKKETVRWKH